MNLFRNGMSVFAGIVLAAAVAAEEPPPPTDAPPAPKIYTCTDADGNTVYQDDPCAEPKPPPKKPVEPAGKAPAKTKAAAKSKPAAKPAPAAAKPSAPAPPPTKKPLYVVKRAVVLPSLTLPPPPAGVVDPRWATPETTLRTFIEAVNAGDRALAISCLSSSALSDLGPAPEALPLEGLRETVSSFTGYVTEGDLGPFWSIRALRQGERPKWIFFERTGLGEWKIVGI